MRSVPYQVIPLSENGSVKLNAKKLGVMIDQKLGKQACEMDTQFINLCLNALMVYSKYMSKCKTKV